jgi:hypothetical protein
MTAENTNGRFYMQNPGDLRVPDGVVIEPAQKTLIVKDGGVLPGNSSYDSVVKLGGSEPTEEDEKKTLEETTFPIQVKRGT